jgi:hypothetical protein
VSGTPSEAQGPSCRHMRYMLLHYYIWLLDLDVDCTAEARVMEFCSRSSKSSKEMEGLSRNVDWCFDLMEI